MPYAIEMAFDPASDARVRALWQRLAAMGGSTMQEGGSRPHFSLVVSETLNVPAAQELLDDFARTTTPFPLSFAAFGMFPQGVAYLAPKCTAELLALQANFFDRFQPLAQDIWQYYTPAQWNPHCALSMELPLHLLVSAFNACRAEGLPIICTVCDVGLIEFPPVKLLHRVPLSGSATRS